MKRKHLLVLLQYVVFLFVLVVAEIGVAVLTLIFREEFLVGLDERLTDQLANKYGLDIENHYQSNNIANKDFTTAMDFAQYRVGTALHSSGNIWLIKICTG